MNVGYTGAIMDFSGMGEAARQVIASLDAVGVRVIGKCERYAPAANLDFGSAGSTALKACGHTDPYKVHILHVTPDECPRLKENGTYAIAHFFWETDRLPPTFVEGLQVVQEIWTGTHSTKEAIERSGVKKPVYVFPQPTQIDVPVVAPYNGGQVEGFDGYMFYSIFEWTARKNPELLLEAYLSEFCNGENVGLLLKTYFRGFDADSIRRTRDKVLAVTERFGDAGAKVFLELNPLGVNGIRSIHARGDCYVSPHRGEGWGIPIVEAMVAGNPVIVTGYGGVAEYMTHYENGALLPFTMEPVADMLHATRYYCHDQKWAKVEQADVQREMRHRYEYRHCNRAHGSKGHALVREKFNYSTVGNMMKQRLEAIEASL